MEACFLALFAIILVVGVVIALLTSFVGLCKSTTNALEMNSTADFWRDYFSQLSGNMWVLLLSLILALPWYLLLTLFTLVRVRLTSLHRLIEMHRLDVVESRVARNPEIVHLRRSIDGFTPLHTAASTLDPLIILFLLTKGADVNALDKLGRTPLDLVNDLFKQQVAASSGGTGRVTDPIFHGMFPEYPAVKQLLVQYGGSSNAPEPLDQYSAEESQVDGSPAVAKSSEKELCYLCGKRLNASEQASWVCRECKTS
jgi:hypothetical protein